MSEADDVVAVLMEKVENLYSLVNRMRFYRDVMMNDEADKLAAEVEKLRTDMKLSREEIEKLADELDEYYITGASSHGEVDPLSYWTFLVKERLSKK